MNKVEREVILDNLIKTKSGRIKWLNSIGRTFKIIYDGIEYNFLIDDYTKESQILSLICNNKKYTIQTSTILKGNIGTVAGKISTDYLYDINETVNDNKVLEKIKYKVKNGVNRGYKVKCIRCGYIRSVREYELKRKHSCAVCHGRKIIKGINDIGTTHPHLVSFMVDIEDSYKYGIGTCTKIKWKCPNCDNIINMEPYIINNLGHVPCSMCSDGFSYPEKVMSNILHTLNIKYISHYRIDKEFFIFKNKKYRPEYDFYFVLNNQKYIIEMDGGFHKKPHGFSQYTINDIEYIDSQKDILAEKHNFIVIRIDSIISDFDYIFNNIKESVLSYLFDLNVIDKNEINRNAYGTLVKNVCNKYSENPFMSIIDISKFFGISKTTTQKYLKQGSELQWCDYNTENNYVRSKKYKKVICLNTNQIFNRIDKAEKWVGSRCHICNCCKYKSIHAGRHPITNELLSWMYYDEYIEIIHKGINPFKYIENMHNKLRIKNKHCLKDRNHFQVKLYA